MSAMNEKNRNQVFISCLTLIHYILAVFIFYLFWMLFRYQAVFGVQSIGFRYNFFVTAGYGICLFFFNRTYNSYLLGYSRIRMLVFSQFLAQLFSIIIVYPAVSIAWNDWRSPEWFLPMLAVDLLIDIIWSYWGNRLYFRLNPEKKTILIYRNPQDKLRFGSMKGKPTERLYRITKELMYDGTFSELRKELEGYDAVFVAGVNSRCRNGILKYCEENDIRGFFLPHIGDVIMQGTEHIQTFDRPVLQARRKSLTPEYSIIKRVLDIVISAAGLVVLSPLMGITALAIKIHDGGPVFYKQIRLTRNAKQFQMIKFRSMKVDAEKDGIAKLSTGENDDRITPVGRIMRKRRIDELPQLWNILIGDMSIVGPRPERPEIAEQYYRQMPEFRLRLQVKAGLTGYAQVYGKYNTDPYEKLEFDLLYINHMSIIMDLQLMFSTFGVLFSKESTMGFQRMTAMDNKEEQGSLTNS